MKNLLLLSLLVSLFLPITGSAASLSPDLKNKLCEYYYMTPLYRNYEPSKYEPICKNIWRKIDISKAKMLNLPYKEFIKNF